MYYVVKMGEEVTQYYFAFEKFLDAKDTCISLKKTLGHQYEVIQMKTVWHTQTLDEIMER